MIEGDVGGREGEREGMIEGEVGGREGESEGDLDRNPCILSRIEV